MPTRLRRIGVLRDEVLDRALRNAGPLSGERSDAGQVRALALRGAAALLEDEADGADREFAERHGICLATGTRELRTPPGSPDAAASEALEWARGGR